MKKKIELSVALIAFIIVMVIILTFTIAAGFSFPNAHDDFGLANAIEALKVQTKNPMLYSIKYMVTMYNTWQGTFSSSIILALLSPLNGGGVIQLRIILIMNSLLFWWSLYVLMYNFWKCLDKDVTWKSVIILYAIVVSMITGFKVYRDNFYWFVGAMPYTVPMSLMLLGVSCLMLVIRKQKKKYIYLGAIFAFIASGGVLQVAGLNCWILLIICAFFNKGEKKCWIVFLGGFLGALINSVAPGNFLRHNVIDTSGLHVLDSISMSFTVAASEIQWLFFETLAILFLIMCAILGGGYSERYKLQKHKFLWLKLVFIIIATPLFVVYPVVLGYSSIEIPNRCQFVLDFTLIILTVIIAFLLGIQLNGWLRLSHLQFFLCGCIVCSMYMCVTKKPLNSLKNVQTFQQIYNRQIPNYAKECLKVYSDIEHSDSDVVVIKNAPSPIANYIPFEIQTDPQNGMNKNIARYYGKKYIQLEE